METREPRLTIDRLHRMLRRQVKRHLGLASGEIPVELEPFIKSISDAYDDVDADRRLLDHAAELSSKELLRANAELVGILQALPDMLFRIDGDGTVTDLRKVGSGQSDYMLPDIRKEPPQGAAGGTARLVWDAVQQVRETKQTAVLEYCETFGQYTINYEARLVPFVNQDIICLIRDITAHKQAEEQRKGAEDRIRWQANHDDLTGLPNRPLFQDMLEEAVAAAESEGVRLAILYIDLDRFKNINDSLGHAVADVILMLIGERLDSCLQPGDILSRMGGDEFAILIPSITEFDEISARAQNVVDTLNLPLLVDGREVFVPGSIGVAVYPDNGITCQALLQYADVAMYGAKEVGGGAFSMSARPVDLQAADRLEMESSLRHAFERNEFVLHCQPIVDIATNLIVGAEALVRWNNHDLGQLAPSRFIPLAEETGLVLRLGEWVLTEAVRNASKWEADGMHVHIAVNLFARQFEQKGLPELVGKVLEDAKLSPDMLHLELTESALIGNSDSAIEVLNVLRDIGVQISLDDFGTGYSSLSYLRRLPVDILKIDRSFVNELNDIRAVQAARLQVDPQHIEIADIDPYKHESTEAKIVRSVIQVAHALGLVTVAEGVETEFQRHTLQRLGCDYMQGYLFSRPVPICEFEAMIKHQHEMVQAKVA